MTDEHSADEALMIRWYTYGLTFYTGYIFHTVLSHFVSTLQVSDEERKYYPNTDVS